MRSIQDSFGVGLDRVGQLLDDLRHPRPELAADPLEQRAPAAVLNRVVQDRRDRLVLVASVLEHESGDDQ